MGKAYKSKECAIRLSQFSFSVRDRLRGKNVVYFEGNKTRVGGGIDSLERWVGLKTRNWSEMRNNDADPLLMHEDKLNKEKGRESVPVQ